MQIYKGEPYFNNAKTTINHNYSLKNISSPMCQYSLKEKG